MSDHDFDAIAARVSAEIGDKPADSTLKLPEKVEKQAEKPERVEKPEKVEKQAEKPGEPDSEPTLTPAQKTRIESESKARDKGWMPKKDWVDSGHDEDDWVSAKRFLKTGEEIDERISLKKALEKSLKTVDELSGIVKKGFSKQAEERIAEKMALRDRAIELGDKESVHKLDKAIAEESNQEPVETTPEEIQTFVSENKEWWGIDPVATQAATLYYGNLEKADPKAMKENLEKTRKYVARRFPDLFPQDQKDAAEAAQEINQRLSTVSTPNPSSNGKPRGKQWSDLPSDTKRVAEELVRKGVLTKEQYLSTYEWN